MQRAYGSAGAARHGAPLKSSTIRPNCVGDLPARSVTLKAALIGVIVLLLLIGLYLAGALRRAWQGVIAGGAMSLVYGLLYMLVLSEDYSLLLGSIILFAALAAVMLATRRVDWYRLKPEEPSRTEASYP